jgi:hypothetical protein
MSTPANSSFSTSSLLSTHPHSRRSFLRRFPTTRESYGRPKEREVLATISGSTAWRRVGKPYFRQDVVTGIVFRRAPASRLSPVCRITVCVPYEVTFHVAVRILNLCSLSLLSVNSSVDHRLWNTSTHTHCSRKARSRIVLNQPLLRNTQESTEIT